MKKSTIFLAALVLGLAVFLYASGDQKQRAAQDEAREDEIGISINGALFKAIVRDTPAARAQGLSGRPALAKDEAMVFAFPNEGLWGIWMKDMRFSIDILWLDSDRRIVFIEKDVSPETYPDIFFPEQRALYVIELPAGAVDEVKASPGDSVSFVGDIPVGK